MIVLLIFVKMEVHVQIDFEVIIVLVRTDLVVEHVERYWCPTITSADFTKDQPFRFKNDTQ